jgi:hypothetical protein
MDEQQQERFAQAVERRKEEAERRSREHRPAGHGGGEEAIPSLEDELRSAARTQDDLDPRAKNSGHGKKTADKWNQ